MARQEDRSVAIALPDSGGALEGIFCAGAGEDPGGAVIAPPHPLYGGSMDSPVLTELAWACKQAGQASLRFNWRGVGASFGAPSGEAADADADYAAALETLAETVPGPLIAAGYSFGAAAALRAAAATPRVRRLLLVAPPPVLLDEEALAAFPGRALALVGDQDTLAPATALAERFAGERRALEVIAGADHFFGAGLGEIGRRAAVWLGAG